MIQHFDPRDLRHTLCELPAHGLFRGMGQRNALPGILCRSLRHRNTEIGRQSSRQSFDPAVSALFQHCRSTGISALCRFLQMGLHTIQKFSRVEQAVPGGFVDIVGTGRIGVLDIFYLISGRSRIPGIGLQQHIFDIITAAEQYCTQYRQRQYFP